MKNSNIKDLHVKHEGDFNYTITLQENFDKLSEYIETLNLSAKRVCIVTDSNVSKLYLSEVEDLISNQFTFVTNFTFPAGEESKNLSVIQNLYEHLITNKFGRNDILIALGGGVVGDLTGFAAATYLRGVSFIQIPTTLLSQVDSSIGGKTGVDFRGFKNMVGAFHQPLLVYMNLQTLHTLDDAQFSCGMGEVLKTALIRDSRFYEWIISNMVEVMNRENETLSYMVSKCCNIKKSVVEEDPKEQGIRAILNLGHTIGHAIEKLKEFHLLHGQCVALGTIAAAFLSHKRELLTTEELYEIRDMNVAFDLPMFVDGLDANAILEATKSDKKMENDTIKFVLLKGIGHAIIDKTITDDELLEAIQFIRGESYEGL